MMSTAATTTTATMSGNIETKPRSQKSRNGCLTCKKKRLKCDETKPGCNNCSKRNIECGGYSTNFRWKTFEETSTSYKVMKNNGSKQPSTSSTPSSSNNNQKISDQQKKKVDVKKIEAVEQKMKRSLSLPESDMFQTKIQQASLSIVGKTFQELARQNELMALGKNPYTKPVNDGKKSSKKELKASEIIQQVQDQEEEEEVLAQDQIPSHPASNSTSPVEQSQPQPITTTMDQLQYNLPSTHMNKKRRLSTPTTPSQVEIPTAGQSGMTPPALLNSPSFSTLVKAFTDFDSMNVPSPLNIEMTPRFEEAIEGEGDEEDEDDDNESLEESNKAMLHGFRRANSVDSIYSNGSLPQYRKELIDFSNSFNSKNNPDFRLPPSFTLTKKNELVTEFDKISNAFDKYTCAIMSIRNGPTENPWRTVIWPMALDHSVLFKSLASMTLLHIARNDEETKKIGMTYMKQAINELAQGLTNNSIPNDVALATCLALVATEAWSTQVSSGLAHLRGAKSIINKTLASKEPLSPAFKALCNIFIYHDVLAKVVSLQLIDSNAYDANSELIKNLEKVERDATPMDVNKFLAGGLPDDDIDPLLGCARDLFLIIGRTASLISKTRTLNKISLSVVSTAVSLKTELENWKPKNTYKQINLEDPYCDLASIVATAESYRFATLLYLHQAVPEIPSQSSKDLAEKVLMLLASIPTNSKTCLLHIFPLLVASCEMDDAEDREWIINRWSLLSRLMWIGNIDRAMEIVKEVWRRKDALHSKDKNWDIQDQIEALTADKRDAKNGVESHTHWSTVMKEWGWEVMLG